MTECPFCHALLNPESSERHLDWHFAVDDVLARALEREER